MGYRIREQDLNQQDEETELDYSFVMKKDYRDCKYDELDRHITMLEQYSKSLIDFIIMAEYPLKFKPALHAEMDSILTQLSKSKELYKTFTVAQQST